MTDADALLKSLSQPIAVVGNGTMLNKHDEIEAHATIIRFNDFADEGFEQHVGHHIDLWCVTCCGKVKHRRWKPMPKVMTIATTDEQHVDIHHWLEDYPDMAVPKESWITAARELKGSNPTTGLVLLMRLAYHGMRFTAFGFDGLRSGHYWDKNHQHEKWHPDELPLLMELAKRGMRFG